MPASFRQLEGDTTRLYEAGEYRAALDLLDARSADFPAVGHRCKITFFRACLLARASAPDLALDVLEAGLAHGLWWSDRMLADADLDPCRGERLDRIVSCAAPRAEPATRFVSEAVPSVGALLVVHGGVVAVDELDNPWACATDAGWTVHRPVSSQRFGAGLATWTDLDLAVDECRKHIDEVGGVDAIGSFSLGGSLALRLITEVVRVPVIMVAPSLRPAVVSLATPNVDGAVIDVITGQHDPFLAGTNEAAALLDAAGAQVSVAVLPDLGHDFPDEFADRLAKRLAAHRTRRP